MNAAFRLSILPTVLGLLLLTLAVASAGDERRSIRVFVALCDNATQGIQPVGAKIGNGDDPEANLYWGCSDGLGRFFPKSANWKTVDQDKDIDQAILRRLVLDHQADDLRLVADAYRGSEMKRCLEDFFKATQSGKHALVVFIGHNGLMDTQVNLPAGGKAQGAAKTDAIVLCCLSDSYFSDALAELGARPILMTRQLMYPGSFVLHDGIESWRKGGSVGEIRTAAGKAYAANQKISQKSAVGVFADLAKAVK